ncbi:MAG TPA: terminase large subunit [Flavobacteriales bacterium]|nr:terminase large subunit [Flavobacteriales bacterium]
MENLKVTSNNNEAHNIAAKYKEAVAKNATVDDAIQYAHDVISKKIVAGKLLIQAAKRFINDLENGESRGIKFSRSKAERALNFFPTFCCHIKGELKGQPIILEPWQAFIIAQLFGFHKKNSRGNWVRRFVWVYIEVARKNGKSTLLSGIALYMLAFDGEGGAEVYCAAVDKGQAKIVWDAAAAMIELNPMLRDLLKITQSKNLVELTSNYSKFSPLSKDNKKLDGLNVHCGILDELHAHRTREVFDLVKDGMSSRHQPILAMITTAGVNKNGICYEQRKYVAAILDEESEEENDDYLGVIFSIDDDDDPYDSEAWIKANPCLDISKPKDSIHKSAKLAKVSAGARINFLIKDLNRWVDGGIRWIDKLKWEACGIELPEFIYDLDCWLGVDLSTKSDLTALVQVFKGEGVYYIKPEFYFPKESLKELPDEQKIIFKRWIADGHLNIMDGHMIDLDKIEERIEQISSEVNIKEVCVDPWKAQQLVCRLDNKDIQTLEVGQTVKNFSSTMETIDGYIDSKFILHDNNPVMAWMMGNVEVSVDHNDNIFPRKANNDRANKIDGATALFTAANRAFIGGGEPDAGAWLLEAVKEYK